MAPWLPRDAGAGGGGCVVFMVEPGTKPAVEEALTQMGGQIINFAFSRTGLEVWAGPAGASSGDAGEDPALRTPVIPSAAKNLLPSSTIPRSQSGFLAALGMTPYFLCSWAPPTA